MAGAFDDLVPASGNAFADLTTVPFKGNASMLAGAQARPQLRDALATLQGPTFGFGDEIIGGVVGGAKTLFNDKPLRQNYEETRDFVRGAVDQQKKEAPGRTAMSQMIASLPVGGPLAKLLPGGASLVGQTLAAAGVGGLTGAINALGDSEAKDTAGLAADVQRGGGLGLAMGGAFLPIARGVTAAGQVVASHLNDSAAVQYARQKLAEAFARDQRTVPQAAARLDRLGPEATIADAGGQNTRQMLDTLATLPGQTKNQVENLIHSRQAGRADRMIGAAESAFGTGGVRMASQVDDWLQQRAQQAGPLYAQVRQIQLSPDAELLNIVRAAEQLGAGKQARTIATANRESYSLNPNSPTQFALSDLDYMKQGLYQLVQKNTNPDGKLTPVGGAVEKLRQSLVQKLDDMTGGASGVYAQARQAFAGPSELMDAARLGRTALTKDDATIKTLQTNMTQSERDAFALGAFESLRAKLGARAGQTQIMELWREKGMQEKLQAIFGSERAYREFAASVAKERQLKQLETVGRGSQTASRLYGAGDLDAPAVQAAGQAVTSAVSGNVPGVVQSASNIWNRVKLPEPVRDQMGQILLSRNKRGLLDLEDVMRQVEDSRRREMAAYGLTGGLLAP
jgi:hypothetical protein